MSKIQAGQFAGNNNQGTNSSETIDEFQSRIFGGIFGNDSKSDAFYQRLDRIEKARDRFGVGPDNSISSRGANTSSVLDGLDESFDTLSDGMDGKLKKAATYFEFNPEEIMQDDYSFRPDVPFLPGSIYDTKVGYIHYPEFKSFSFPFLFFIIMFLFICYFCLLLSSFFFFGWGKGVWKML